MVLNKKDIINNIAVKTGMKKKDINEMLIALEEIIYEQLAQSNIIFLRNLFKIIPVVIKPRKRYNPLNDQMVDKEAYRSVKIVPSMNLKRTMRELTDIKN